jgi:hypothetical protein
LGTKRRLRNRLNVDVELGLKHHFSPYGEAVTRSDIVGRETGDSTHEPSLLMGICAANGLRRAKIGRQRTMEKRI